MLDKIADDHNPGSMDYRFWSIGQFKGKKGFFVEAKHDTWLWLGNINSPHLRFYNSELSLKSISTHLWRPESLVTQVSSHLTGRSKNNKSVLNPFFF